MSPTQQVFDYRRELDENQKQIREKVMETLFSYLDKGIDDVEAGRMHTVDEAFQIIRERMDKDMSFFELQ